MGHTCSPRIIQSPLVRLLPRGSDDNGSLDFAGWFLQRVVERQVFVGRFIPLSVCLTIVVEVACRLRDYSCDPSSVHG